MLLNLEDWNTHVNLIQSVSELPNWTNANNLYLDVETTSGDPTLMSVNPWHNCKLLGIAVLVDDESTPIYIPLRHCGHSVEHNVEYEPVMRWVQDVISTSRRWINHNIKYDAHVLINEGIDVSGPKLVDTLVLCKLAPREERFTYNLTDVMREWCAVSIQHYEDIIKQSLGKCKDYGYIPIDKCAPYAAVDVLSVRELRRALLAEMPDECAQIVDLELALTSILLEIENNGMQVDLERVEQDYRGLVCELEALNQFLAKSLDYPTFYPHVSADCKKFFLDKLNMPILEVTESGAPSFGSTALLAYKNMLPEYEFAIDCMLRYKDIYKLWTSFTKPYRELHVNGRIHCDYNQIVRTGRMSCRNPNMQQLSPEAKVYIVPSGPGRCIVDIDFSQIEFRLIAHFIQANNIITEYQKDPKADYHTIVANLCNIDRKPAKTMNFMLGYGGGRKKCVAVLSSIKSLVAELTSKEAIVERANEVYDKYHRMVPTLKSTTFKASDVMRKRGYVKTLLGRRRYLPRKAHFKAFNSVVQGSAADLFKAALVRIHPYCREHDLRLIGCVHDSFVLDVAEENLWHIPELCRMIATAPEGVNLRVVMRADSKMATTNWGECN